MGLKEDVLRSYISSSVGIHVSVSAADARAYVAAYRRYLRGWLGPVQAGRWLDLGCGQGQLMWLAQGLGYTRVEGCDVSEEMVEQARRVGLNVRCQDVFSMLRAEVDASADVISCFDVIEHMPRDAGYELVRLARRVLRPGGTLLLKLPNAYSPFGLGITANDLTHDAAYTPPTILQLGRLAGFPEGEAREVGPQAKSAVGLVRCALWWLMRRGLICYDIVETGAARSPVYTRVMLVRLRKP